jgi:TetR/AcrR family transcriptional regulator, cholesterol catabolism regulator
VPSPKTTTRRKRARNVTAQAEARRRQILDEAARLFTTRGYYSVSVEDIAEASGIGKATLYHYFKSREEILLAMHEVIADEILAHADQVRSEAGPVRDAIRSSIVMMLSMIRDRPGYVRVFFEHYGELSRSLQTKIAARRDAYASFVEDLIRRGIDEGECRPVDPHLTTLALFGMTNWAYQWYRPSGPATVEEIADAFVDVLFDGIGAA